MRLDKKDTKQKTRDFLGFSSFFAFFLDFLKFSFCANKRMPIGILGQGSRNEPLPCFLSKIFVNNLQTNKASLDYQFFYDIIYLVDPAIISICIRLKEVGLLL